MKSLFTFVLVSFLFGQVHATPKLSKDQVTRIGEIVLKISNRDYQGWFNCKDPIYDETQKVWRFAWTREHAPSVVGARIPVFSVRDSDGFVMIGTLEHHGVPGKSELKFKMPNNAGPYIRRILKE